MTRENPVFTEGWRQEFLLTFDLIYWWSKSPWLEAIEKNVPSSLKKKKLSAEVKNQGAL